MAHPYPFDPELAAALALAGDVDISDPAAARAAQARELAGVLAAVDTDGVQVSEAEVPGPAGGAPDVRLRLYRPRGAAGPLPVLFGMHGGGFVVGSPDVDHEQNTRFCRELGALVVSVDYRLAPEHPFPAALEDCFAGLCWVAKNAGDLGIREDAIALWGDSSGATLAAGLAMLARDRGGPAVRFQFLHSPALDDRLRTPSARAFTDTPVWNRRNARLSWDMYLGGGAAVPYAAPARASAEQLAGLPPAHIVVMEFDPLRDEGIDYARALLAAGVRTGLTLYPGTYHGAGMVGHAAVVRRMNDEALAVLRGVLER